MLQIKEGPLPSVDELPSELGDWLEVRPPVSHPTALNGDWRAYPHLAGKENWKQYMGPRAVIFSQFLESHHIFVDNCIVCAKCGHGMRADFGGHIAAQFHFKDIGREFLLDGIPLADVRHQLWQSFCFPGGEIRFNHADGAIEMRHSGRSVPRASPLDELPSIAQLPSLNEWYIVSECVGQPTESKGDYTKLPFFSTRANWKKAMEPPVKKLVKCLAKYEIWPVCQICENCLAFEGHVPADKHFKELCDRHMREGVPVTGIAKNLWQVWNIPGGAIKFNHVHGRIDMWRGPPPQYLGPCKRLPTLCQDDDGISHPLTVSGIDQDAQPGVGIHVALGRAPNNAGQSNQDEDRHSIMTNALGEPCRIVAPIAAHASDTSSTIASAVVSCGYPMVSSRFASGCELVFEGEHTPEALPRAGEWLNLHSAVGYPQQQDGDWKAYTHLTSKQVWKKVMASPTALICRILENQRPAPIWPECSICDRSRGFQEHICAEKHLGKLFSDYFKDGVSVDVAKERLWQQWLIRGGAVRINHADGVVQMCRGALPVQSALAATAQQNSDNWRSWGASQTGPPPPPEPPPYAVPPPMHESSAPVFEPHAELSPEPKASEQKQQQQRSESNLSAFFSLFWQARAQDAATELERILQEAKVETSQHVCEICQRHHMQQGILNHILSAEHVQQVADAIASPTHTQTRPCFLQSWTLPDGRNLEFDHFSLEFHLLENTNATQPIKEKTSGASTEIPEESNCFETKRAFWWMGRHDDRTFWQSDRNQWFYEGDPDWLRFDAGELGPYHWNRQTGIWFLERTGREMGEWKV